MRASLERLEKCSLAVRIQDRGMHIILPAGGRPVPQLRRDCLDSEDDVLFGRRLRFTGTDFFQRQSSLAGSDPRAKIFRGEIIARNLAQIIVHILGMNPADLPFIIDIMKQLFAWNALAFVNDLGQFAISQLNVVFESALSTEVEA